MTGRDETRFDGTRPEIRRKGMTIASELLDLEDEDGLIDPTTVVDWARDNPASALHGAIEWDDAIAAHAHRLWQVRRLVAIHIVTDDVSGSASRSCATARAAAAIATYPR